MSGKSQYSYKLALQMAQSWSSLRQPLEASLTSNNKLPLIDQQFIKALDISTFYKLTFFLLLFTITSTLFKVKYYNPSMSDAQQLISESLSDELALFSKLIPTEEQKPKLPSVNLLLKKSLDGELQKKLKARQQSRRSRSRSRDRAKKMRKQQNLQDEKKAIIVLSDDEEESAGHFNKFRALEKGIYDPIECYEQQVGMTYRQKQKIDRLMERGMRHFREGKVRDQLSFQIFNTIEAYFK